MITRPSLAAKSPLAATAGDVASWWWCVARMSARSGWDALPGPWPVKVALIVLLAAGQLIPGEADELVLLLLIGYVKRRMDARRVPVSP